MESKQALLSVYNALTRVETKGESTLILADCMRLLAQLLQNVTEETEEEKEDKADDTARL